MNPGKPKDNKKFTSTRIPVYINPSVPNQPDKVSGPTNYVGIAGVGKDAPTLPKTSKQAGVFGYNRSTRIRDITDGTSNTVMVSEASKNLGPWAAGGESTIRALTKKPYINGPDGLGGFHTGGCLMLMGDGSVQFHFRKHRSQHHGSLVHNRRRRSHRELLNSSNLLS